MTDKNTIFAQILDQAVDDFHGLWEVQSLRESGQTAEIREVFTEMLELGMLDLFRTESWVDRPVPVPKDAAIALAQDETSWNAPVEGQSFLVFASTEAGRIHLEDCAGGT